jgi:hypothetical protein
MEGVPSRYPIEPFVRIASSESLRYARGFLHEASADFAVVDQGGLPQTVVYEGHLLLLDDLADQPLDHLLVHLPPLNIVQLSAPRLDFGEEAADGLARFLARAGAPGALIEVDDHYVGVIAEARLANGILRTVPMPVDDDWDTYIRAQIPAVRYVCARCADTNPPPPTKHVTGGSIPRCPRDLTHGLMVQG